MLLRYIPNWYVLGLFLIFLLWRCIEGFHLLPLACRPLFPHHQLHTDHAKKVKCGEPFADLKIGVLNLLVVAQDSLSSCHEVTHSILFSSTNLSNFENERESKGILSPSITTLSMTILELTYSFSFSFSKK